MTRNRLLLVGAGAAVLLTAACAHLRIGPASAKTSGFRYYLPRPYLLVTSDSAKVVWLPDLSKPYAVQPVCGIGTQKVELTLDDGWKLTKATSDVDSKLPETIDKILSGAGTVLTAAGTLAGAVAAKKQASDTLHPPKAPTKSFALYGFVYDSSGRFVGLESVFQSQ